MYVLSFDIMYIIFFDTLVNLFHTDYSDLKLLKKDDYTI